MLSNEKVIKVLTMQANGFSKDEIIKKLEITKDEYQEALVRRFISL